MSTALFSSSMIPTADIGNWIKAGGKLVLKAFGTRLGKLLIFAGVISTVYASWDPGDWIRTFLPSLPTLSEYFSLNNLNADIVRLCGYSVAADKAISCIDSFIEFVNWVARVFVVGLITIAVAYWTYALWGTGQKDLRDVVS